MSGYTALMLASQRGNVEIVQLLLEHGARTDMVSPLGQTALILAALNNHPPVVKLLLDWGSQKDFKDVTLRKAIDYANNAEIRNMLA